MKEGEDATGFRLRTLGRLELEVDEGDSDRLMAQPRRLALLLYLVLRRPGGFVGRDELIGLFWPDDAGKARASLRQALRFLRQCVGSRTVVGRGDELGVPPELVSCDALDFRRALQAGDTTGALDLYAGELLPGFYMPDAPEAQRWLDRERRTLRDEARAAALAASEAASATEPRAAAAYARRALAIDPTDEPAARQLIRMLVDAGDRAGAVAAYEAFAAALAERLDLEPSDETIALIGRVRAGDSGPVTRDVPGPDAGPRKTNGPASRASRVVVRPFENVTGDAELDVVGRMIVDWVSRGLSEIRGLDVAPPGTPEPDDAPLPDGTIVEGRYYRHGDKLVLHARLTDLAKDRLLSGPEPVVVPADAVLAGLDELTSRVAAVLAPALNPRATHVYLGARPPTFAAYRLYMEGLEAFIDGDWTGAAARLARCAEEAPEYALPRIVLAISRWNLGQLEATAAIAAEAASLRGTVNPFERGVLDMVLAWLDGDWSAALAASRTQAALAPGSIPSFQVAEEARRLNRLDEARATLESLDPEAGELKGWILYWVELTTVLHLTGDHAAELAAAERARSAHPDDPVARWLEVGALVGLGRIDDVERRLDDVLSLPAQREPRPGRALHETSREMRTHGFEGVADRTLTRAIEWYGRNVDPESETDAAVLRDFGRALYDAGDLAGAAEMFARLVAEAQPGAVQSIGGHHGHLRGHLDEGILAAIAAKRGDVAESARWREILETMDRRFLYGADRLWLGILALLDGDEARAVSEIRRALAEGLTFGRHLHTDPDLAVLRDNPRFRALVRPRET